MRSPEEIVNTIKTVCKERNLTVKHLESSCDLSNGQIGKWGKRNNIYPPHDKLSLIAKFLDLPVSYLTGEEQKEKPTREGEISENDMKLYDRLQGLSEDDRKSVDDYISFILSKRK